MPSYRQRPQRLNVRISFWILIWTSALFASLETSQAAHHENESTAIILVVGESRVLPAPGADSIQAEKSDAIQVTPEGRNVRVTAVRPGSSEIQIGNQRYDVSSLTPDQMRTWKFLKTWITKNPGLETHIEKAQVILSGQLFVPKSWIEIANQCPHCMYINRCKVFPSRVPEFDAAAKQLLQRLSLPHPALRFTPDWVWSIEKKHAVPALQKLAQRLGIRLDEGDEALTTAPMIQTQIYVMEVRRDFTRKYGVSWPSYATATVLPLGTSESTSFSPLDFSAQALENEGLARVLASPTILSRSGERAEFLAGGEFPIKLVNYRNQDVIWKKYGISLKVSPKADRWGRINLGIETEITSIDPSRTVDGIPGLFTNRVSSHFDLEKSATVAISGLIKNEDSRSVSGLPGLAQVPILGSLFGSKEFRENRTELVIFVRPQVIDLNARRPEIPQ